MKNEKGSFEQVNSEQQLQEANISINQEVAKCIKYILHYTTQTISCLE